MRYWQITTRRLSKAAAKLEMDDEWHPFASTPHSWYRVWRKKIVQRVNFVDEKEEKILFDLIAAIEPLPELATVSGFREELNITLTDDRFWLTLPVGYEPPHLESIQKALLEFGIRCQIKEGLLYAFLPIDSLSREALVLAQSTLVSLRLFFQAVLPSPNPQTIYAALEGFRNSLQ